MLLQQNIGLSLPSEMLSNFIKTLKSYSQVKNEQPKVEALLRYDKELESTPEYCGVLDNSVTASIAE